MNFLSKKTTKISTLLYLISITAIALNPSLPSEARTTKAQSNSVIIAQNNQSKNSFTAVGKKQKTTGTVTVVRENGKNYLVLSSDFSTPNGPDLLLILHRNNAIAKKIQEKDYITIAPLKSISGEQRYVIPDNVNLDDYQSVGIWCRQFNITFASAPLFS